MAQTNQNNQQVNMGRNTYIKEDVEEVHVIHDINDDSAWFIVYKENIDGFFLEKAYYGDIERFKKLWEGVPIIEFIDDGCSCIPITKEVKFRWNGWDHTLKKGRNPSFRWGIYRDGDEMLSISQFSVRSARRALQSHWDWVNEPFEGDIFY